MSRHGTQARRNPVTLATRSHKRDDTPRAIKDLAVDSLLVLPIGPSAFQVAVQGEGVLPCHRVLERRWPESPSVTTMWSWSMNLSIAPPGLPTRSLLWPPPLESRTGALMVNQVHPLGTRWCAVDWQPLAAHHLLNHSAQPFGESAHRFEDQASADSRAQSLAPSPQIM
jgi:hypothetical protein